MPEQYHMKTWKNPTGKRELNWSCGSTAEKIYDLDTLVNIPLKQHLNSIQSLIYF